MRETITIFQYKFSDEELEKEFNDFFYKYDLTALFTNDYRAGHITVSYVEAKSVVNETGFGQTLKQFKDYLTMAQDNKKYEEAIFRFIYESRTVQGLVSNIRKAMEYINTIRDDLLYNTWNIVFYNKDLI